MASSMTQHSAFRTFQAKVQNCHAAASSRNHRAILSAMSTITTFSLACSTPSQGRKLHRKPRCLRCDLHPFQMLNRRGRYIIATCSRSENQPGLCMLMCTVHCGCMALSMRCSAFASKQGFCPETFGQAVVILLKRLRRLQCFTGGSESL